MIQRRATGKARLILGTVGGLLLLSAFVGTSWVSAQDKTFDIVIANGRVMDPGSGLDAVRNLGIRAGKIRAITLGEIKGNQTIEAKGLIVAPGFIDLHEHGQEPRNYQFQARDGV